MLNLNMKLLLRWLGKLHTKLICPTSCFYVPDAVTLRAATFLAAELTTIGRSEIEHLSLLLTSLSWTSHKFLLMAKILWPICKRCGHGEFFQFDVFYGKLLRWGRQFNFTEHWIRRRSCKNSLLLIKNVEIFRFLWRRNFVFENKILCLKLTTEINMKFH